MPGSSLWLLPPKEHPLQGLLTSLIKQTSSYFHSPHLFIPHITLTSEINPSCYDADPQAWLESLDLGNANKVSARFEHLNSENVFVRKLYIKCQKTAGLKELAKTCRMQVEGFKDDARAEDWVNNTYNPHLSLLYHDCSPINSQGLATVGRFAEDTGVREFDGWDGGRVVLVPTDKPIDLWSPLAQKQL